jgi:hypothetical protein
MSDYTITRQEILDASAKMLGLPFVHQGRSLETGVDCAGLLVVMGQLINYPRIFDVEGYRRVPNSTTIRQTLEQNLDQIPLDEVREGDIYLMRLGSLLPRHVAICWSNASDPVKGVEPKILHASPKGVRVEAIRNYPKQWYVAGFRVKGVRD